MIAEKQIIRQRSLPDGFKSAMVLAGFAAMLVGWQPTAVAEVPGDREVQSLPAVNHVSPARVAWRSSLPAPLHVATRVSVQDLGNLFPALKDDLEERSITSVTTDIQAPSGEMPENVATGKMAELAEVSYASVTAREWGGLQYCWDAPVLSHGPLYFEEVNLERHGYGPKHLQAIQPVLSGAQFLATVPTMPYKIVAEPPSHPVYTLGHYRPGSPVPYRVNYPPLSLQGGVAEAGLAVGLVFLIP
jgi:hypothetical protein